MNILQPIKVGKTTFKNRIMFPPLTTGYEERDGSIGEQCFQFYRRLAEGGTGYIVIGDVAPVATFTPTPKLFREEHIPPFRRLADACHSYDCRLGIQLFHPEYDVDALNALFAQGKMAEVRQKLHHDLQHFINEVTEEQLQLLLDRMEVCAKLAARAGVDCIQIHGDRLVGSLCSKILNQRTDSYGGSFENRTRFALALVARLKQAVPDLVIDYKLPVITPLKGGGLRGKGGLELDEAKQLALLLEQAGVDMLHVAQANHTGNMADTIPPMGTQPYGFTDSCAAEIKKLVSIPVSCVGRIVSPSAAEAIVSSGKADIVGLGRSLLSDPDFARKCEEGHPACVRECIMCNKGCTDNIQNRAFLSCILNAENGYEGQRVITPAQTKKRIAVIGAGVAGLEAARVAAEKGQTVTVFEQSLQAGGQVLIASVPPRKEEMLRILNYYEAVFQKLPVSFRFGTTLLPEDYADYDEIIAATGAYNFIPPIPGHELPIVTSAWDVLAKKSIVFGRVLVIGGGLVGVETAEYLAKAGCEVTIVEMLDAIAKEESNTILPTLTEELDAYGVIRRTRTKLDAIHADFVTVTTETEDAEPKTFELPADFVVMAVGARKQLPDLKDCPLPIHYVGDCSGERPSNIEHAVKSAYDTANAL